MARRWRIITMLSGAHARVKQYTQKIGTHARQQRQQRQSSRRTTSSRSPSQKGITGWSIIGGMKSRVKSRISRKVVSPTKRHISSSKQKISSVSSPITSKIKSQIRDVSTKFKRSDVGAEKYRQKHATKPMSDISRTIAQRTGRVAGVIRGFETPVNQKVNMIEHRLGLQSQKIPKPLKTVGWGIKELGYGIAFSGSAGVVETVGMIPGGVETIYKHPKILPSAAIYGTYQMGKGTFQGITTSPTRLAGEFLTFGAVAKCAPKLPKMPSQIPKISPQLPKMPSYIPKLPSNLPTPLKGIGDIRLRPLDIKAPKGLTPEKVIKFKSGMRLAKEFAHVKPAIQKPLDFTKVKSLPGKSGLIVEKWIKTHKEQHPVIFGSGAAKTQVRGARQPGDIDLTVKNPSKSAKQIYNELYKTVGKENIKITESKNFNSAIVEIKIKGKWHHAVDLHKTTPVGSIYEHGFKVQKPTRIGGIDYTPIGEQFQRISSSVLTKQGDIIAPKPHRALKDIQSFESIAADMIKAQKERAAQSLKGIQQLSERQISGKETALKMYQTHAYPEPIYPTIRAFQKLPSHIKLPPEMILAGYLLSKKSTSYNPYKLTTPYKPSYPQSKKYTPYDPFKSIESYKTSYQPSKKHILPDPNKITSFYKPPEKSPYKPPEKPLYKPPEKSPYKPPEKSPYKPPEKPLYKPPEKPLYKPLKKSPYKLPKDKKKRLKKIHKKYQTDSEMWQIRNPIAGFSDMMFGRQITYSKKKKSIIGKKTTKTSKKR